MSFPCTGIEKTLQDRNLGEFGTFEEPERPSFVNRKLRIEQNRQLTDRGIVDRGIVDRGIVDRGIVDREIDSSMSSTYLPRETQERKERLKTCKIIAKLN